MKRVYVIQTGEMSKRCLSRSPGCALRGMLRWAKVGLSACGLLVRYRYRLSTGAWSEWFYQDTMALSKEP